MTKKILNIIILSLAFILTILNVFYSIRGSIFSDIKDLPKGKLSYTVLSPDGKSNLNVYTVSNNLGVAVRGEIVKGTKKTNVFWQTETANVDANWINNRIITINGVTIDVYDGGSYDCRRGKSLFQEGSLEGKQANYEKK